MDGRGATRARAGRRCAIAAAAVAAVTATAGVLGLAGAALGGSRSRAASTRAATVLGSFRTTALAGSLHFLVHLPPGYATSGRRYPVVYFLHGLPAGPASYRSLDWLEQALDETGEQAILVPTDPTGTKVLDLGSAAANEAARVHGLVRRLAAQFRRYPTCFAFYVGRGDPTFVPENAELDEELDEAGVAHAFTTYARGHTIALWRAHAPAWLTMALRHLLA